jgi:hypothetical protein
MKTERPTPSRTPPPAPMPGHLTPGRARLLRELGLGSLGLVYLGASDACAKPPGRASEARVGRARR